MSEHTYTREILAGNGYDIGNTVHSVSLDGRIKADLPGKTFRIECDGSEAKVIFDDDLNAGEIVILDATVALYKTDVAGLVLSQYKGAKRSEIDAKTTEIIGAGFSVSGVEGKVFSLSKEAQAYWNGLGNLVSNGLLVEPDDFPLRVNTLDDEDAHDIADIAEATVFFASAAAAVKNALAGGTALKDQVRAAVDIAGVDAVVDNR